ncbi:MAG: phosphate ABC transporter substrate-binding protein PstS [Bdellovibrionales bacterium]|nr:phosphate ABC transporter substrate-binding protein PstS [Bdellovibrionales bacterium]
MKSLRFLLLNALLAVSVSAMGSDLLINGAGASFPYPLYSKWFSEYTNVEKSVKINYQSIGSGGGIRQFLAGTTDFGASDAPMKDEELAKSQTPILHIPTTLGAVAVTYNIPGVKENIQLTAEVVVDIFAGKIKKWDDEKILKLNPKVKFPKGQYIIVAHRSDGSGTTSVFTDYLANVSAEWGKKYGKGKDIKWPTGLGGKGNEGVTGLIRNNPGAIGYVEMTYAMANNLQMALVKNKAGEFILPSTGAVSKAAAGALAKMPADYRVSITNSDGKGAYPISAFTYLLIHQKMDSKKGKEIVKFLKWAMGPGQKLASPLHYSPLPDSLIAKVNKTIATIKIEE